MLTFKAHKKPIYGIAFSPDGKLLATSSSDETVKMWNLDGSTKSQQYPGSNFDPPIAFSPDGLFLARGGMDFGLLELSTGEYIATGDAGETVAFSPDGKEVAAFGSDDPLERWTLPQGKPLPGGWGGSRSKNRNERFPAGAMAYSPDGKTITLCYGVDTGKGFVPHLLLWDRKTGKLRQTLVADFKFAYPTVLAYSPDGNVIAGNYGPVLGVVDVKTGAKVAALKPGKKHFKGLAFTPNGKRLIAVNTDATARVYETATWTETTGYEWKIGKLTAVAVAPDGLRAACGSHLGRVVVWDLE